MALNPDKNDRDREGQGHHGKQYSWAGSGVRVRSPERSKAWRVPDGESHTPGAGSGDHC